MILITDVLTALEGAQKAALSLLAFTEDNNDPVAQGLIGVIAGINAASLMLEETIALPDTPAEDDACTHPEDMVVIRRAGASTVRLCTKCNEFLPD